MLKYLINNVTREKRHLIFLISVLFIAGFFRLWKLSTIPPGLYPDEAINGNEAITNPGQIFYPENNGREGLFINLISLYFSIFGISILGLRFVSAVIGILTVFGLYLLTKELLNDQNSIVNSQSVALLSSFFLAISFWHTNFSRIAFRGILVPFILVLSFYFLLRGFRIKKIFYFIISGIFFGLGFYTYISYRFVVLLLPLILATLWSVYKKRSFQKEFIPHTLYFLLFIFITALPIGIYFLNNPQHFVGRATGVSIFATENPLREFLRSLISHLAMFNFYGDPNWRHNFAKSPQLFWPIGIFFLIGLIISLKELSSFTKKAVSIEIKELSSLMVILWIFVMLLPGILTSEGVPHSLRTIGVIPPVYILAGLGAYKVKVFLDKKIKRKRLIFILYSLFFLLLTLFQFQKYFFWWAEKEEVKNAFSANYVEIGNYLNSLPLNISKYVIVNVSGVPVPYPDGIPMPAQTVMFIERTKYCRPQSVYLLPRNLDQIKMKKETVIAPLREDEELFNELFRRFPEGKIKTKNGILIYEVK